MRDFSHLKQRKRLARAGEGTYILLVVVLAANEADPPHPPALGERANMQDQAVEFSIVSSGHLVHAQTVDGRFGPVTNLWATIGDDTWIPVGSYAARLDDLLLGDCAIVESIEKEIRIVFESQAAWARYMTENSY